MRLMLVVNMTASAVTDENALLVEQSLREDHELTVAHTTERGHAGILAENAVADGLDAVVVFAGDGTLNEAANGLVGSSTALGVLPGGSTNVFARTIGMGRRPAPATDLLRAALAAGTRKRIGVGVANGRHFLFHVGMGFDVPYWRAHGGPYAACIVRVPAEALHPNLARLRQQLAGLQGVRFHPDHFLHIMLQELGFVVAMPRQPDEISEARLEEFAQSIVEPISGMRGLSVTLGGVNSFQDAAFLEVGGGGPLARLHERLFDLAAMPSLSSYTYLPHCTIAHYDGTTPHDRALSLLAPWRTEVLGQFAAIEAEIVTLDPTEPYPELMTYAVIPFCG